MEEAAADKVSTNFDYESLDTGRDAAGVSILRLRSEYTHTKLLQSCVPLFECRGLQKCGEEILQLWTNSQGFPELEYSGFIFPQNAAMNVFLDGFRHESKDSLIRDGVEICSLN